MPGQFEGLARISFDIRGRPVSAKPISGRLHRLEYDQKDRPSAIVDAAGNQYALRFDELNQLVLLSLPGGARYEFAYEFGLAAEIRRSRVTILRLRYDQHGNLNAIVDGKGQFQQFDYNAKNSLTAFTDRLGAVTQYGYQPNGILASVTTPNQAVWRSTYDERSQLSSITFPDGAVEQYQPAAAPTLFWRRDGEVVELAYDEKHNLTEAKYPGGQTVQLSYNKLGHLTTASNGIHDVGIEYDEAGYRSAEEVGGRRIQLGVGEDQLLHFVETHRHERITFEYGADQRVKRLVDWDNRSYGLSFDPGGRLTEVAFPGGVRLRQTFAPRGTLETQTLSGTAKGDVTRSYEYDANDVLIQVVDRDHGAKRHQTDAEDRLVGVSSQYLTREYTYDGHGNLLGTGSGRYAYNALDQISDATDGPRVYDRLGNLVEWNRDGRSYRCHYNAQNQLIQLERSGGVTAVYEYDALGRRITKRVGGITTAFTWWGDQLLAEDTDGPEPQHIDYLFLPNTHRLLAMRVNGSVYFAQTDHLDCPIRLLDADGQVVWAGEPHGYEYPVLIGQVRQPFRFPGQYFDDESGLHYNRHRYYDPVTGRYLSPDPLFFKDRTNLYIYAGGNPAQFCDPSGLFLPLLVIGGALLIGAALGAGHSIASDLSQGRSVNWGNAAASAGKGALVAAGGLVAAAIAVATLPVTAPAAAVLAIGAGGALLTGAIMAGAQAPAGHRMVACAETIPFVRQFTHDYEKDPNLKYPTAQRVVDGSFDLLTLGLMARGARAVSGKTVGDIRTAAESKPTEEGPPGAKLRPAAELDAKFGAPKKPVRVKPWEQNSDGSTVKNRTVQEVKPGSPPKLDPAIAQDPGYIWLVDENGKMFVAEEVKVGTEPDGRPQKLGHPTLVEGGEARIGGELKLTENGWEMNNKSGRYSNHPDRTPAQLNNAAEMMKESGVDVSTNFIPLKP